MLECEARKSQIYKEVGGRARCLWVQEPKTASQFTLSKASGTVSVSFVEVRDSIGTGGATWNAFTSVDGGNNTGWIFAEAPASTGNMFMLFY